MKGSITDVPRDTTYWVSPNDNEEYQDALRGVLEALDDDDYADEFEEMVAPINDEDANERSLEFQTDGIEPNNIQGDEYNEQAQEPEANVYVNEVDLTEVYDGTDGLYDANDGGALD